jgi:KipI family sensor histidine kinase inhibitor
VRFMRCGDVGVLVELATLEDVLSLHADLEARPVPGLVDLVPALETLLVKFDPGIATPEQVCQDIRSRSPERAQRQTGEVLTVPVRYDGEDLAAVSSLLGISVAETVRRHTGQVWTVAFAGFSPGFGYLVGDAGGLQVSRRASPRTRVPAGAVALAGEFTGVYPRESPGGWRIVGHTTLKAWDLHRDPPALLTPGTRVSFASVDSVA